MDRPSDLFRELCESAGDLLLGVDAEGRLVYANRAFREALGYQPEDVSRLSLADVLPEDGRGRWTEAAEAVQAGRPSSALATEFLAREGGRVAVEGGLSRGRTGSPPPAICGAFRLASGGERQAEDLHRLFHLSLDLLCVAGTDGYFKRINPAFERVLGYSEAELLSRSFMEFVHPDDHAGTLEEVGNLARGLPVVDFENRYRARDGAYRWLAWRSAPVPERGLIYAVARDITEHKKSQELLARQTKELARSNADLEQFAYAASHDLRAPLRTLTTLSEWIEEDVRSGGGRDVGKHLAQMRDRVRRMESLTDDLLRYARAGRPGAEVGPVDTAALIDEMTGLLNLPEGFQVIVTPGMPVFLAAKAPLGQVFRNLIGNAVKHHDRPAGQVVVSARDRGPTYEFSVADDGPGIPEHFRDRLFKMFQRLETSDRVDGSGIGLALVKRHVESRGGEVSLDPAGGRGATFRFTWPKEDPHADDPGRR
jgi:PAS domain S-box-containing protein